jgi:uncharacterized protein (DUF983 family)
VNSGEKEETGSHPAWIYVVTALLALIALCAGLLRRCKSVMVAQQFHHKATDGVTLC